VLLLRPPLGAVRVDLDPTRLLEIRRADRGGSFAETTKTRRRVDLWLLGEMQIRAF
jgi:hypothetical protein